MVSQLCVMCGSTLNCQTLCLGARPRYNLVVDEDVKKPTNQPTNQLTTQKENKTKGESGRSLCSHALLFKIPISMWPEMLQKTSLYSWTDTSERTKTMSKIFNKNTIKVSCLTNVKQKLSFNNNSLLQLHRMKESCLDSKLPNYVTVTFLSPGQ